MSVPLALVVPASPRLLVAAWPELRSREAAGWRVRVAAPGPLGEILPAAWIEPVEPGLRPDLALVLEPGLAGWWAALRSGARRRERLVVEASGPDPGALGLTPADRDRVEERLARVGIGAGEVVVAVRTARGAPRPWVDLLRDVRRELRGVRPVLLATADELWTAVRVHEGTARAVPVLGSDGGARLLAALLGRAAVVLGADDWVLALAGLLGTPVIPWDPPRSGLARRSAPTGPVLERLRARLPGSGGPG